MTALTTCSPCWTCNRTICGTSAVTYVRTTRSFFRGGRSHVRQSCIIHRNHAECWDGASCFVNASCLKHKYDCSRGAYSELVHLSYHISWHHVLAKTGAFKQFTKPVPLSLEIQDEESCGRFSNCLCLQAIVRLPARAHYFGERGLKHAFNWVNNTIKFGV